MPEEKTHRAGDQQTSEPDQGGCQREMGAPASKVA